MLTALALIAGVAAGIVGQAWRTARNTGTSTREQIQRGGGPGKPVVPK